VSVFKVHGDVPAAADIIVTNISALVVKGGGVRDTTQVR
jgi:hypothetical protein